ncbi:choline monooxygenase [Muriicola jejuensis]|uniref:Rieske 2Fe-2S domain-containing protein n=1 Tax=Muriicola jejuensis TaxID=504488 RepID=A0A6P0UCJ3_9FLAO|nr:aromatic ring-hydroxylating dioxygenase subunit alpha [Muriicola jejuensis]NER09619.1 Rieske 2Fe-2S domain-containing protein [Muriicola jejuensis]SMP07383.1 choline monooxygenase [Muriicola jejuensis]
MAPKFFIDPDIRKASTLPSYFYRHTEVFEALKEKVFYRSWQWAGDTLDLKEKGSVSPFTLLPGFLEEPLLMSRDGQGTVRCLSNVCTHRGNLVVERPGKYRKLVCGYHGRRFSLDGRFEFMPEFGETMDFPRPCDDLHTFPVRQWGPFVFAGLSPAFDFQSVIDCMDERIGFLPLTEFKRDAKRDKDYTIQAHWALYCDNYLEGFHIPFVHEDLNEVLDYGNYETVLYDHCNLQIGYAEGTDEVFDLPKGHIDYGKKVAAYYYWVFPNMMFNFYPWGLSVNLVQPQSISQTKVSFLNYVYDATKLDKGAGTGLDKVEMEDEAVVEGVHKGIRSRYYQAGRFSPTREKGVHHFHSLLARFLDKAEEK